MAVRYYRELLAWQLAIDLALAVYVVSKCFPRDEAYGLTSQIRRAAVSVASNIAEGQGRGIGAEFAHHLRISICSIQEVETQTILANRLGYIDEEQCNDVLARSDETCRLVRGLHASIARNK